MDTMFHGRDADSAWMDTEIQRLRRENAELRHRALAAERQRDVLSPVVRNLALNPFADEHDLRTVARRALRSVQ